MAGRRGARASAAAARHGREPAAVGRWRRSRPLPGTAATPPPGRGRGEAHRPCPPGHVEQRIGQADRLEVHQPGQRAAVGQQVHRREVAVGEYHRPVGEQRRRAVKQTSQRGALGGCQLWELLDPAARFGGEAAGIGPPVLQLQSGGRQPAEAGQQLASPEPSPRTAGPQGPRHRPRERAHRAGHRR